jgi:hypothetical protein
MQVLNETTLLKQTETEIGRFNCSNVQEKLASSFCVGGLKAFQLAKINSP